MLNLVPVLDLQGGDVVRGVGGERQRYQPNRSCLLPGCDPVATAGAFHDQFGCRTIYVADLDALQGQGLAANVVRKLAKTGLRFVIDAGVSTAADAEAVQLCGAHAVVVALESITNLETVGEVLASVGPKKTIFSLDIKHGKPLGSAAPAQDALEIAQHVIRQGVERMIVLDLAGVGSGAGVSTISLCKAIRDFAPDISLWSGGGVRSVDDLTSLNEIGLDGVLVASALHDGLITPEQWRRVSEN